MADGSITFSTELDNKELEKQLSRLNADVKKKTEKLTQMKGERLPLEEQSAQVAANLDRAKELLAHMNSGDEFFPKESIKEQEQSVAQLQKEWDAIQTKVESYDTKIRNGEADLARTKEQAGAVEKQLSAAASGYGRRDQQSTGVHGQSRDAREETGEARVCVYGYHGCAALCEKLDVAGDPNQR